MNYVFLINWKQYISDNPEELKVTPKPILNLNNKLTVIEGETIGPFNCTADCNPPCNISWKYQDSNAPMVKGIFFGRILDRNIQSLLCVARSNQNFEKTFAINLDVQCKYFYYNLLYLLNSNVQLTWLI